MPTVGECAMAERRTVGEVLAAVADSLFPHLEEPRVQIDSRSASGDTPLHTLAWRNDLDGAEILVGAGADVDAVGEMGETPLHVAISNGNLEMVTLFIRAGADPSIRSEFEESAAEKAMKRGGPIAEFLRIQAGRIDSADDS